MKFNTLFIGISLLGLVGCATSPDSANYPMEPASITPQVYTYTDLAGSKTELWRNARNYIATAYGDSKAVLRVESETSGTLIGKGLIRWKMLTSAISPFCYSEYNIHFVAKDNKARLRLELVSGTPSVSKCSGWTSPSKHGYEQIVQDFSTMSTGLEDALRGKGTIELMTDF